MDKQRAKLMLEETFGGRFDSENFVQFIKELFNKFEDSKKEQDEIPKDFQKFIDSYSLLGKYEDSEGKSIDVLAVKLKKNNPESARTMQRNFMAKHLSQRNVNSALVAFYGEDVDNWRFSFVKLEYHLEKDEKGNIKPATSLTPPKRYSFLVGKTEPSHTAQSRFLELLIKENSNPMISEIESSFSVEKVTKEFFEKYKELFLELEESLNKIVKQDKDLAKEFIEKGISTIDFTKKLLGQIVFIYFLQKKGWLGIEKDEKGKFKEWGTGHKDFLKKLYKEEIVGYNNFFNDILEPLFYEALAIERENDYYSRFRCKIPFLNGGLFEPLGGYNWTNTDVLLDNKIFGKIIETFDLYNFTVKEDEPLEKEVAIDPEMLGKVFENLLEIKDRKSKGSYYTPREIVHYMCQESLINYLETGTGIEKKHIEGFIHNGEISNQIKENYGRVDKLLKEIKVVDPAIGSGAFPVGMMMEIIRARGALTDFFPKNKQYERTAYNFKRECIEDSLYGVDIDPGAVDIAQLRLWLSLIVDETDIHKIQPLPNLDYKIMCGNSLLEEFEGIKLLDEKLFGKTEESNSTEIKHFTDKIKNLYQEFGEIQTGKKKDNGRSKEIKQEINKLEKKKQELILGPRKKVNQSSLLEDNKKIKESQKKLKELKELHKQFFNENNRRKKNELRKEIEKLDWEFIEETLKESGNEEAKKKLEAIKRTRSKPFFLWKLYFAEIFQRDNPRFDVVIANPPYVSVKGISEEDKKVLSDSLETGEGRFNLFTLFLEKGHKLLRKNGILTFIMPEGIYSNVEYRHIREYLLNNSKILYSVLFDYRLFEASVDTTILSIKNIKPTNEDSFQVLRNLKEPVNILNQKSLFDFPFLLFPVNLTVRTESIVKNILKKGISLDELLEVQQGIIYSGQPKEKVFSNEEKNKNYKKVLDGRDILKWKINWEIKKENRYIKYDEKLHRPREERIFLAKEKLLLPRRSTKIYLGYDNQKFYALNTAYILLPINKDFHIKYALACLNSKLINFYYSLLFFGWQITIPALNSITIPKIFPEKQKPFIELVDKILNITKDKDYLENPKKQSKVKEYEKEIDQLVYKLYDLTKEEIETVEGFNKK